MQRINVIGASGSGKTTLAREIATRLGHPYVELDALHHLPDWQERPTEEFRSEVAAVAAQSRWVIDGNYTKVRDIVWSRAETVIFLDLPRWKTMAQLVPRTLRRVATRQELWNGNRERWANLVATVPEENILLWSWTTHQKQRDRFAAAIDETQWAHIVFQRLESRRDIRRLLESVTPTQTR
ncbi:MAG: AAA family ATPase [Acidimicrobiia bacterium]|nr:AAA family ATPase [Acidimicrobiia bacterium]